jgi:anti-sigma B factor antagonist
MKPMLTTQERSDVVIAKFEVSRSDLEDTARLRAELEKLHTGAETRPLLLDLSAVAFVSSVTIGTLVELANRCRRDKRRLALIGVQAKVNEVLRLCTLDSVFAIHPDADAALADLSGTR